MTTPKNCLRCGMPANWGALWGGLAPVGEDGICRLCRCYDLARGALRDFGALQKTFEKAVSVLKGKYEYDVAVGFSGGKDSSFICYMLKTQYGCNVLAVTADLGFMPSGPALANVRRVTSKLSIDHVVVDLTSEEFRNAFRVSITRHLEHCTLHCPFCVSLCWDAVRKITIERHIPCFVMGSDRGQMLGLFDDEDAHRLLRSRESGEDLYERMVKESRQRDSMAEARQKREYYEERGVSRDTAERLCPPMAPLPGTDVPSLLLDYFAFHPYEEARQKRILQEEVGWVSPSVDHLHAHHDCLLHDAAVYAAREALGESPSAIEFCVDAREGQITREDAMMLIAQEKEHLDGLANPYAAVETAFGIGAADIERIVREKRRHFVEMAKKAASPRRDGEKTIWYLARTAEERSATGR